MRSSLAPRADSGRVHREASSGAVATPPLIESPEAVRRSFGVRLPARGRSPTFARFPQGDARTGSGHVRIAAPVRENHVQSYARRTMSSYSVRFWNASGPWRSDGRDGGRARQFEEAALACRTGKRGRRAFVPTIDRPRAIRGSSRGKARKSTPQPCAAAGCASILQALRHGNSCRLRRRPGPARTANERVR